MENGEQIKILAADDEDKVLKFLSALITKYGYAFERASNGIEAIEKTRKFDPDIILLDVNMPEMDGMEACRRLKEDPKTQYIPIIILTATEDRETKLQCLQAGANDFLTKPVDHVELMVRINNLLQLKRFEEIKIKNQLLTKTIKAIEAAKKEWELTMDCIDDMVILVDREGKTQRCNKSLTEFTGKSYNDILGKNLKELLSEQGIKTDSFYGKNIEIFHGQTGRWFMLNSYPLEDTNEFGISGSVITMHDFTEMKRITEELERKNLEIEENRKVVQFALDEISLLIQQVALNKDFCVRFKNPNLKKCYEAMSCTKKDCPCYGKEEMRCWQIAGTYCSGRVQGFFAEKFKDCTKCPVFKSATSDPIYQIGEHFNNMMHILESHHKELEKAYAELKAAQAQILQQEKMASIGQLAAGIAHEINNPIGFIMSNLNSLLRYLDKLSEFIKVQTEVIEKFKVQSSKFKVSELEDILNKINGSKRSLKIDYITEDIGNLIKESLDGAERVKKIVQDLKSFSRVDEAEHKMADINAGIESTINIVWNELKYKATVKKEYGDIPLTKCNQGQLNQVFMNLLVNAAHAIEKQGEITVKTWHDSGYIYISISDTGSGITKENISRIFEPFFTTKEAGKGTGLGLSIAYDIVRKHNGDIIVDSEVGKGTTFTVKIPVVEK